MADWNTVRFDPTYEEPLDPEIIPLCDALNAARFVTSASCCGHGNAAPRVWFDHSSDERIEIAQNKFSSALDSETHCMDNKFVAVAKTAETMTFRPTPDIYRAVRKVCGDLCINGQEFLRRAVVRELLYNGKKAK